jgi:cytochrome b561
MAFDKTLNTNTAGNASYTYTAIALHWITFALIASAVIAGEVMVEMDFSPAKLRQYSYHKWIGVTVFILTVARLIWRTTHPAPPLPLSMPAWERRAASLTHNLLYGLLLVTPFAGYLSSSAHGFKTVYLGVLPLPDLVAKDKVMAAGLEAMHSTMNKALVLTVALHALASLKHHFLDKDDVLKMMLGIRKGPL